MALDARKIAQNRPRGHHETMISLRALLLLLVFSLGLNVPAAGQSSVELQLVRSLLNQLQPLSFASNREYCGFIGYDPQGRLAAGKAQRGGRDDCTPSFPRGLDVIASFHTHGGFDPGADSEIPSVDDVEADEADGVDGWVATPGGRLWYIDTTDMIVTQVCGIGCLRQDPKFRAGWQGPIARSYSYRDLLAIEGN
jgi:hypothetical protein